MALHITGKFLLTGLSQLNFFLGLNDFCSAQHMFQIKDFGKRQYGLHWLSGTIT
jgi:hypothetical protein